MSDKPMTEEEFFGIWSSQVQAEPKKLEFRLYYDENGFPLFFSMEDLPGNYVVVDREMYLGGPRNIRVVNGKLKVYQTMFGKKLVPAEQGQACDTGDICVVVSEDHPHTKWNLKHQEPKDDETD
jgi:hypothetical protein